jgi:hypothetical protein
MGERQARAPRSASAREDFELHRAKAPLRR